jgi:RHS repeat-associated protein
LGGRGIKNVYAADGRKLKSEAKQGSEYIKEGTKTYSGNLVFDINDELDYIIFPEGRIVYNTDDSTFNYEYHLKDHLGSTRVAFVPTTGGTEVVQENSYYPFGAPIADLSWSPKSTNRYGYNGKEHIKEFDLDWVDYGARFYNPIIGRFMAIDPMTKKHANYTPYAYVYNNPLRYIDLFGLDSLQRIQAVQKADEYVSKNPGDSYPTVVDRDQGNFRGQPGEKVDCSGMADNCMIAGEEPSSKNNGQDKGVANIMVQSEKIGDKNDLSKAEVGNFVTLNSTRAEPLDTEKDYNHIAVITQIERDDNNNIVTLQVAHSSGTAGSGKSGPKYDTAIKNRKEMYWGRRITGIYKWDKRPD